MEHTVKELKAAVSAGVAAVSAMLGWFGWLAVLFALVMGLDWITGTAVAHRQGQWSSSAAREGLWHKAAEMIAVASALLLDSLIATVMHNLPGISLPFQYTVFLAPLVLVWYIVTELGSIVENLGLLGARIPGFLVRAIRVLSSTVDTAGDSLVPEQQEDKPRT